MAALIKFGLKCAIAGGAVYTAVVVLESPESLKSSLHHLQAKAAQNLLRVPVDVDLSLPEVNDSLNRLFFPGFKIMKECNIKHFKHLISKVLLKV